MPGLGYSGGVTRSTSRKIGPPNRLKDEHVQRGLTFFHFLLSLEFIIRTIKSIQFKKCSTALRENIDHRQEFCSLHGSAPRRQIPEYLWVILDDGERYIMETNDSKHSAISNAALLNDTMTAHCCGGAVMRKLAIADPEVMRIAIQQEIARSDESRCDHRLNGLLLV